MDQISFNRAVFCLRDLFSPNHLKYLALNRKSVFSRCSLDGTEVYYVYFDWVNKIFRLKIKNVSLSTFQTCTVDGNDLAKAYDQFWEALNTTQSTQKFFAAYRSFNW